MKTFFKELWLGIRKSSKSRKAAQSNLDNNPKQLHDKEIDQNILGYEGSLRGFVKIQKRVLGTVKYAVLYPLIKLVAGFVGRMGDDNELLNKPYYQNLNLLSKSIDKGLVAWVDVFNGDREKVKNKAWLEKVFRKTGVMVVKDLKKIVVAGVRSDSAYLEMLNCILLELYKEMSDQHGENPTHTLYKSTKVNDINYFVVNTLQNQLVLKERVRRLRCWHDKEGKLKIKRVGGYKHMMEEIAAELNTTPDKAYDKVGELVTENYELSNKVNIMLGVAKQGVNLGLTNPKQTKAEQELIVENEKLRRALYGKSEDKL